MSERDDARDALLLAIAGAIENLCRLLPAMPADELKQLLKENRIALENAAKRERSMRRTNLDVLVKKP